MSDNDRVEQELEVVIAQAVSPEVDRGAAVLGELAAIRRRLEFDRLLLGALLAVAAVCLALLIVIAGRGV